MLALFVGRGGGVRALIVRCGGGVRPSVSLLGWRRGSVGIGMCVCDVEEELRQSMNDSDQRFNL